MLQITVPSTELWDEKNEVFIFSEEQTLQLEHSLVSISKWESKWHKAFLGKEEKTDEQILDYIKCMTLTPNVRSEVYLCLTKENIEQINAYMVNPMTATTFSKERKGPPSREIVTSELIYYWMIALNIPQEYEHWPLNRLMTLIQICNIKNEPPKKMGKRSLMSRNAALNAARRQQLNTNG